MATKNGDILAFKKAKLKKPLQTAGGTENSDADTNPTMQTDTANKTISRKSTTSFQIPRPTGAMRTDAQQNAGAALSNGARNEHTDTTVGTTTAKRIWPKLPSFAPPRDLTLGGRGPKKVFTPNLNVERKKNLTVKTSKDTTIKRGGNRGGRGSRGGGRGSKTSTLIQTKGVFSDGAGEISARKSTTSGRYSGGGGGGGGGDDSSSSLQRPVLSKDRHRKINTKEDEKKLYEITGDSDEDDCFDYRKTDGANDDPPIRLNEAERMTKLLKVKELKKEMLRKEEEIKTELNCDDDDAATAMATAQRLQKLHVAAQELKPDPLDDSALQNTMLRYPKSIDEFLQASHTQLFLMQLPDTLPCETDIDMKDLIAKKEQKAATEAEAPTAISMSTRLNLKSDYDWKTMEEGQVGKIVRYKSGKIQLRLGKSLFDLNMAMEPGFIQDVVSIKSYSDQESKPGAMVNLGPIHAKINATPHWEACMQQFDAGGEKKES